MSQRRSGAFLNKISGAGRIVQATTLTAALFAGTAFAAQENGLLKATIEMDRQYIPALIATSQQNQAAAQDAMSDFSQEWVKFSGAFAIHSTDPEWQYFMDIATNKVSEAFVDVQEGKLRKAHEALETVRITLHGLRERNGIDYYVDELNAYHQYMENIVKTIQNRKSDQFTKAEIKTIQKNWAEVWPRWENIRRHVSRAEFDQTLFGFSDDRLVELKQAVAEEQAALYQLKRALLNGSDKLIADAGLGLVPGFKRTYRTFGDLPIEE